jgi:hypothetical protein
MVAFIKHHKENTVNVGFSNTTENTVSLGTQNSAIKEI